MRANLLHFLFIPLFLLLLNSCVEEEKQVIPNVYVNFSLNLLLPNYNVLNGVNTAIKYASVGYDRNGVIVYRYSLSEFYAFDATCPQHIDISTSINLDENGLSGTATCPHCKTTYSLASQGYPNKGYSLKKYNTSYSNNTVYIFN